MNKEQFDKNNIFGIGNENDAYKEYFTGMSYLNPLNNPKDVATVILDNITNYKNLNVADIIIERN